MEGEYNKKLKMGYCVYPSPFISPLIVEPYNAVISTACMMPHLDVVVVLDNKAIYDVCSRNLDIERSSYSNLNRIIA